MCARCTLLFAATLFVAAAQAQALLQAPADPAAPLFAAEAPLTLTLTGALGDVFEDRAEERPWHAATLAFGADEAHEPLPVRVRTRGFFRLHRAGCDVPPLHLDFRHSDGGGTPFSEQRKVKLVTHCRTDSEAAEQRTLIEYGIYRAYARLTDYSFRTRLVRITYDDVPDGETRTRWGFLLEHHDHVAARHGGIILSGGKVHPEQTERETATMLALFQYMIGNTDWTISTRHNVRLLHRGAELKPVAVPYDFDWAGLVDAPYATPDPQLGLRSVRERKFMGFCRTEAEFDEALARFRALRPRLIEAVVGVPGLDERHARDAEAYLSSFFDEIAAPRASRRLMRECQRM